MQFGNEYFMDTTFELIENPDEFVCTPPEIIDFSSEIFTLTE